MISTEPIKDFDKMFDVVSLFIICNGKMLLLKRQEGKPQGGTWGRVAGKVDAGESLEKAILRETLEETGIEATPKQISKYAKNYYVRHKDTDFVFYVFIMELNEYPHITLSDREHSQYAWFTPQESLALDLVPDEEIPIADLFFDGVINQGEGA